MLAELKRRLREGTHVPCDPPVWARGGHPQTLIAHFIPSPPMPSGYDRVEIPLPDGDTLVGRYFAGRHNVLLYLFHGLSGSADADYMRRITRLGLARGYHVLAMNHRGCGEGNGLARAPYHSGRADDLAEVIRWGRTHHSDKFHLAVGFSLSGNALLLLNARERGDCPPDLGITVNAPIQLEKAALALRKGWARLYDLRFAVRLRKLVLDRFKQGLGDYYEIPRFVTLHDFDNYYTAPAGGFVNREDYYHQCSAARFVHRIQTPTVALTSLDDPMVDGQDYLASSFSEQVLLHLEPSGGHLGYLSRKGTFGLSRWLDRYLDRVFQATEQANDLIEPNKEHSDYQGLLQHS